MAEILGVKIDSLRIDEAIKIVHDFLYDGRQHKIFTPNPEMLVDAHKDVYFKRVLNQSDLNICDGFGITLVSLGKIKRITGVDFMVKLCELAEKENKTVYFLGGISKEMLGKMVEKLKVKFPKLKIAGFNSGPWIDFIKVEGENKIFAESNANDQAIDDIIMSAPDILFVGFGHEKQEKWIAEHLRDLPSVKIIMGVGGSFDYLSDTVARAPCFLRKIGLEWLYRLIIQPWRFKRILKAIFIFPLLVVKEKL